MAGFIIPLLSTLASGVLTGAGIAGGLAAGAIGATGGFAAAGARLAQTAVDVSSGVIGAGTGLIKGAGKAIGVEADQSTSDEQGAKALPPGVELNKNGVMVKAKGAPGAGQILPGQMDDDGNLKSLDDRLGSMEAPDRSDAGPVQQILDYVKVISANTARTAAGIGMLSTSMQQSNTQSGVDDEKGDMSGEGKAGIISKAFGSVSKTLKAVGSSLGKTAKFMIKGLAVGGLLYLFINKKDEIKTAIAGLFEYFHNLAMTIKNSDDPLGLVMDLLKDKLKSLGDTMLTIFEDFKASSLATLGPMTEGFVEWLWDKLKVFINETLGMKLFQTNEDSTIRRTAEAMMATGGTTDILRNMTVKNTTTGEQTSDLGTLTGISALGNIKSSGFGVEGERTEVESNVMAKLKQLFLISEESGFRIQFPSLGFAFVSGMDFKDQIKKATLGTKSIPISDIINAQPVLDDTQLEMSNLADKDFSLLKSAGVTKSSDPKNVEKINKNLKKVAEMRGKIQQGNLRFGPDKLGGQLYQDRIDELLMENQTKYLANPGLISEFYEKDLLPDKDLADKAAEAMTHDSGANGNNSIFTHDNNTHRLLEPISKAFENGGGSSVMIDSSSNDNSIKKQGDTVMMPLDVHHSDRTASAFHEWKYA